MRLHGALGVTAWVWLWLAVSLLTPAAALSAEPAPRQQSLAIPVAIGGKSADAAQCVVTFGPPVAVSALAFSPDGKRLAAAGYQEVLLWDLESGKLAQRLGAGQVSGSVGALAFLKDGQLAIGEGTPQGPGAVRIFNVETGEQTHCFQEPAEVVYALAVSPDGKFLAGGGADAVARVWSIEDKKLLATLKEHTDWILGVSFSPDGKLLATASADRNVRIWDTTTWESSVKFREDDAVQGAAFAADAKGLVLAVGGPRQQTLQMRRLDNVRSKRPLPSGAGMPLDVVWTGKANRMYVPCSDGVVRVYEAFGRLSASLAGHDDWVYCVALSPDESKLASGSADGTVKLWHAPSGRLAATLVQLAPRTDQWLILTSEGFFAASSPGALQWKTAGSDAPAKEAPSGLDSAEKVREALAKIEQVAPAKPAGQRAKAGPKGAPKNGTERRKKRSP